MNWYFGTNSYPFGNVCGDQKTIDVLLCLQISSSVQTASVWWGPVVRYIAVSVDLRCTRNWYQAKTSASKVLACLWFFFSVHGSPCIAILIEKKENFLFFSVRLYGERQTMSIFFNPSILALLPVYIMNSKRGRNTLLAPAFMYGSLSNCTIIHQKWTNNIKCKRIVICILEN